jgi:hypothetical protein
LSIRSYAVSCTELLCQRQILLFRSLKWGL